jgi:hypothetical protein
MAVLDDLHRLSQADSVYLGYNVANSNGYAFGSWFKGRLQQSNGGAWLVRSVSVDGSTCGFVLGQPLPSWTSNETPTTGISIQIPINQQIAPLPAAPVQIGLVMVQQTLPQDLTN